MSTEENKALHRRFFELLTTNNLALVDELVTADYVTFEPASPVPVRGREGLKALLGQYLNAFPDLQFTIEDQVAEGDKVVTRWTSRGTHRGDLMGIAPTGKQITSSGTNVARVAGGKLAEDRVEWNALGLLLQLGAIASMATTSA